MRTNGRWGFEGVVEGMVEEMVEGVVALYRGIVFNT